MRDFAGLHFFLRIELASSPKGYLSHINSVDIPIELHVKFSVSNGGPLNNPTWYLELICYLTILLCFFLTFLTWSTLLDRLFSSSFYSLGCLVTLFGLFS